MPCPRIAVEKPTSVPYKIFPGVKPKRIPAPPQHTKQITAKIKNEAAGEKVAKPFLTNTLAIPITNAPRSANKIPIGGIIADALSLLTRGLALQRKYVKLTSSVRKSPNRRNNCLSFMHSWECKSILQLPHSDQFSLN